MQNLLKVLVPIMGIELSVFAYYEVSKLAAAMILITAFNVTLALFLRPKRAWHVFLGTVLFWLLCWFAWRVHYPEYLIVLFLWILSSLVARFGEDYQKNLLLPWKRSIDTFIGTIIPAAGGWVFAILLWLALSWDIHLMFRILMQYATQGHFLGEILHWIPVLPFSLIVGYRIFSPDNFVNTEKGGEYNIAVYTVRGELFPVLCTRAGTALIIFRGSWINVASERVDIRQHTTYIGQNGVDNQGKEVKVEKAEVRTSDGGKALYAFLIKWFKTAAPGKVLRKFKEDGPIHAGLRSRIQEMMINKGKTLPLSDFVKWNPQDEIIETFNKEARDLWGLSIEEGGVDITFIQKVGKIADAEEDLIVAKIKRETDVLQATIGVEIAENIQAKLKDANGNPIDPTVALNSAKVFTDQSKETITTLQGYPQGTAVAVGKDGTVTPVPMPPTQQQAPVPSKTKKSAPGVSGTKTQNKRPILLDRHGNPIKGDNAQGGGTGKKKRKKGR